MAGVYECSTCAPFLKELTDESNPGWALSILSILLILSAKRAMQEPVFTYDVFLSHGAKDKAVVRPLAERLRQDGLKEWFGEWVLKPGDSIPAKIEAGLEHSRALVPCMSVLAFGSDWAQLEAGTCGIGN
jgi:hypothetical protein